MSLHVITGPMFSGKTEELLRLMHRHEFAGRLIALVKPVSDTRSEDLVRSQNGTSMRCAQIEDGLDLEYVCRGAAVVGVDEVQFFDESIIPYILSCARKRVVICSGLDTTFQYVPWPVTAQLMAYADKVDKLTAVCNSCGDEATRTQRVVNGVPVLKGPDVVVGGTDSYEARCLNCFAG